MESTGSFSPSTALPAATSLQSPAIRAEDNEVAQQSASSSRAPSSASTKKVILVFKCKYCDSRFASKKGRGGHERVHSHLPEFQRKHNKKKHRAGPHLCVPSSSSYVPGLLNDSRAQLLNSYRTRTHNFLSSGGAGAGGLAPAQPSSAATGGGGNVGISLQQNQENQYYSWLLSKAVQEYVSQTQRGSGTSGLPQHSLAAPAPAAGGNGGAGDGVHLGGQPEVNQEETTDGIDLTLRL